MLTGCRKPVRLNAETPRSGLLSRLWRWFDFLLHQGEEVEN